MALLFPIPSLLEPALPLLAFLGFLTLLAATLVAICWPVIEGPLLAFLVERRRARELREWQRTQRMPRKARRTPR